jgi:hypothetical protein
MFLNVISVGFKIIGKRKTQLNNSFIGKGGCINGENNGL